MFVMFGVSEAKYVVNEVSFAFVVIAFEIPMCPFGSSIDKGCDRRMQSATFGHKRAFPV